jgi:hypothetical protein
VIDRLHPARFRVTTGGAVIEHGIVGPAVPEPFDDRQIFLGTLVTVGVAHLPDATEVSAGLRRPRRHDIPADAATADVIERAELARKIVRLGVGGRRGGDQPDLACCHRKSSKCRKRFEPIERSGRDVIPETQHVGQEDRIEQTGLGLLRHLNRVLDVGQRQLRRLGMTPRGFVVAPALDEQIEMHMALHNDLL